MKPRNRNKLLSLALVSSVSLLGATNGHAAAGLTIGNTATLSYEVGGTGQTDIDASTNFVEDRLINFTVSRTTSTDVAPDGVNEAVRFTLTNLGNSTQDFLLRAENSTANDPFPPNTANAFDPLPGTFEAFVDDGDDIFNAADTARTVVDLAAGASVDVWVVSDMPAAGTLSQDDISTVALVAQVALSTTASGFITPEAPAGEAAGDGSAAAAIVDDHNGNASPGGTFQILAGGTAAVAAGTGGSDEADDSAEVQTVFFSGSGEATDISTYVMQIASLTVTKSAVAVWDPINFGVNPKSIPGSYVRYTITITNGAGAGDADLTTLSDTLVAQLTLDPDYINAADAIDPPATSDSALGESFDVRHFDSVGAEDEQGYCTSSTGDADGCGLVGQVISVAIDTVLTNATLQADEEVTISFNAIFNP